MMQRMLAAILICGSSLLLSYTADYGDKPVGATFQSYYIKADVMPEVVSRLFAPAADVPAPFRPFMTQYDTYLMKYREVVEY